MRDSNLAGEASILGGLLVVRQDGTVAWLHAEESFGEFPPTSEVVAAAKRAIGAAA